MTPEGKVKSLGRALCKKYGFYSIPINQGGMSVRGIPDDVVCVNGIFLHIEYKAEMKELTSKSAFKSWPTDQQVLRMEECRKAGGVTWVVDANNVHRMERYFKMCMDIDPSIPNKTAWTWNALSGSSLAWTWTLQAYREIKNVYP